MSSKKKLPSGFKGKPPKKGGPKINSGKPNIRNAQVLPAQGQEKKRKGQGKVINVAKLTK